ncbi:MAG: uroporphyrinogen decarboxylase family protein [Clostridiaceae bacterium]|nr:uroporphyrinogen decarboxylase family protein [Clostridiaceae bacterium]
MEYGTRREPDFNNILQVLQGKKPSRPTLFEFFMNMDVYRLVAGDPPSGDDPVQMIAYLARAFAACGYDYVTTGGSDLLFPTGDTEYRETKSLNAHACIKNREDFERYPWPDPDKADYSRLEKVAPYLPGNMKIMASSPDGLLENVINIVGYDNLCLMLYDDPELVRDIFDRVGSILLRHYEISASFDTVGILMINDDWGFNSQPMLSPAQMREYAFPWHKKMVEVAHKHGKPAVLHSCGQLESVMEDIIEDMKFDGKHSYQDNILPVEDAYRRWGGRIAILGGLDVDFLVRSEPEEITARARRMLEMAEEKGGYALGSGNSIPSYIPPEHYFAMLRAAF